MKHPQTKLKRILSQLSTRFIISVKITARIPTYINIGILFFSSLAPLIFPQLRDDIGNIVLMASSSIIGIYLFCFAIIFLSLCITHDDKLFKWFPSKRQIVKRLDVIEKKVSNLSDELHRHMLDDDLNQRR